MFTLSEERTKIRKIADSMAGQLLLIEVHLLRSSGPELYNRDFDNRHKQVTIGGTVRNRVSSQCIKHVIRMQLEETITAGRTRVLPMLLGEKIKNDKNFEVENAWLNVLYPMDKKNKDEKEAGHALKTKQVLDVSEYDINYMADCLRQIAAKKGMPKVTKSKNKSEDKQPDPKTELSTMLNQGVFGNRLAPTTAVFGRMATDAGLSNVYSAIQMNHAYGVNPSAEDYDDYITMDEYLAKYGIVISDSDKPEQSGAGMMDTTDIGSNTYYQYLNVSERIMFENLMRNRLDVNPEDVLADVKKLTADVIIQFIFAVPGAKQNAMASYPVPDVVYIDKGIRIYNQTFDTAYHKAICGTSEQSTADIAVSRLKDAIQKAESGSFAVNDYTGRYWLSDYYDAPEGVDGIAVKDIPSIV